MNRYVDNALNIIAEMKIKDIGNAFDLRELVNNIESLDEEITDLKSEIQTTRNKLNDAECVITELQDEAAKSVEFGLESLEDEGKVEILQRMFKNYTWNELSEIEKQITI